MTRSKKVFLGAAVAFFFFLAWVVYDISRRTTFPGSKSKAKTTSEEAKKDTTKSHLPPKTTTPRP